MYVFQEYDAQMFAVQTDETQKRKFEVESNEAKRLLNDLKERVKKTKTKVESRLLYYLIREFKMWLNINHITVHNNT